MEDQYIDRKPTAKYSKEQIFETGILTIFATVTTALLIFCVYRLIKEYTVVWNQDSEIQQNETTNLDGIPFAIQNHSAIWPLLSLVEPDRMRKFIESFTTFETRWHDSPSGLLSQNYLIEEIEHLLYITSNYTGNRTAFALSRSGNQSAVIVRIMGQQAGKKGPVVILGAHQDSGSWATPELPAPGADDNASGCAVLLEVLRIILSSLIIPKTTIEFHFYAAEEAGLLGSSHIAAHYYYHSYDVVAMMNIDVIGYRFPKNSTKLGVYTDFVDPNLAQFLRNVIDSYTDWTWENKLCTYECSDHTSWTDFGYRSAFLSGVEWSPHLHTELDTVDKIDFEQLKVYAQVVLAASLEIAELS